MYDANAALESRHWWFRAREDIVVSLLQRRGFPQTARILDIGCGTGGLMSAMSALGEVAGVDMAPAAVDYARRKTLADVRLGSLPHDIPFGDGAFDVVTMCDVLEHVEDDRGALARVRSLLRPGGIYFCTVPAYQWMWTSHDEVMHHFRRYTARTLRSRLTAASLRVELLSYYNTLLFPPIAILRLLKRAIGGSGDSDLAQPPEVLNTALRQIFAAERHLLGRLRLPFGVSLVAIATRD